MATPIIMPKFGQMTEESAIVEWLKKEGDKVAKGDILFTVETDKSVMEVESFEEGTLLKIVVQAGRQRPGAKHGRLSRPARRSDPRGDRTRARPGPKAPGGRARCPQRAGRTAPARRRPATPGPCRPSTPALHHSTAAAALFRISPRAAAWRATASLTRRASRAPAPADASSRRT